MVDVSATYAKAQQVFEKGQLDYAISLWMQCVTQDPNHEQAHVALRTGHLRKVQQKGPGMLRLKAMQLKTAGTLKMTKDARKKMEICLSHLAEDPGNAGVRTDYAAALLEAGYPDGAIAQAKMAIETDNRLHLAYVTAGMAYKSKGLIKEAQDALGRALQIKPEDREVSRELRNLAAMESMKRSGLDSAKDYRDTIKDKEKASDLEKVSHLVRTDADVENEINKLKLEAQQKPDDPKSYKNIASVYWEKKKDYKTAMAYYKKASDLAPHDSALKDRVDDCGIKIYETQIKQLEQANDPRVKELKVKKLQFEIKSYERREADRPTDMGLKYELGKLYYQIPALTDKSIAEFQQAVKDPKRSSEAHVYLGLCFQRKKLYDLAAGQFEKALEGFVPDEKRLPILYNQSLCAAEAGNLDKAIQVGTKIMEEDISYKDISQKVSEWMAKKGA